MPWLNEVEVKRLSVQLQRLFFMQSSGRRDWLDRKQQRIETGGGEKCRSPRTSACVTVTFPPADKITFRWVCDNFLRWNRQDWNNSHARFCATLSDIRSVRCCQLKHCLCSSVEKSAAGIFVCKNINESLCPVMHFLLLLFWLAVRQKASSQRSRVVLDPPLYVQCLYLTPMLLVWNGTFHPAFLFSLDFLI